MAATHGGDILAEGEPEKLNGLDEVLKRLVDVKVLDRTRPKARKQCQYLQKHIVDKQDKGLHPRAVVSADDMRKDQELKDCRGMFWLCGQSSNIAEEAPSPKDNLHKADILRPFPRVLATVDTWKQRPSGVNILQAIGMAASLVQADARARVSMIRE